MHTVPTRYFQIQSGTSNINKKRKYIVEEEKKKKRNKRSKQFFAALFCSHFSFSYRFSPSPVFVASLKSTATTTLLQLHYSMDKKNPSFSSTFTVIGTHENKNFRSHEQTIEHCKLTAHTLIHREDRKNASKIRENLREMKLRHLRVHSVRAYTSYD